ncbi:hypothetical protein [Variovorax ginsengisoli]|uniref:Lipoprotein n=1 Tax=Variovorax ginsengisoli TaxID=363844 RepID=A0ABT9SDG1_9BURK|nr:hypothetical protein [Variovorax ginsengisoli]MDP9902400.1 hypothetical protein [Variovorax ginsengisoli]
MKNFTKLYKNTGFIIAGALATFVLTGCATPGETTRYWKFSQTTTAGALDAGGGSSNINTLKVVQRAGSDSGTLRLTGQVIDSCLTGLLNVKIEEDPKELILYPEKTYSTCYDTRMIIKKDGTGGYVERRGFKSNVWVNPWPEHDWMLTPM